MRHCGQTSARGTPDKDRLNRRVRQQWFWHPRTMSGTRANDRSTGDEQYTGLDAIRENREALEAIAATDLPVAPYAQLLLDRADALGE